MTAAPLVGSRTAPSGTQRLLAAVRDDGQPMSLAEHLARFGRLPTNRRGAGSWLVEEVDQAGLRGRGGAGFPTGRKMRTVAAARRRPVVLVNGSEGEPASQKDALLMQQAPHLVLDGVVAAALAVGATRAYLVVHEGTNLDGHLDRALTERAGLDERVEIVVAASAGGYVGSEESALVSWVNGAAALPAATPPRPFERGVDGRATLVVNVETVAHIALIARYGAAWFAEIGEEQEPGTVLLTVSGAAAHPGVVEAATGTRLAQVLAVAGVDPDRCSAILVGGYFGSWVPIDAALRMPVSQAGAVSVGAGLGAGVVVALDERACGLAETARVMAFLARSGAGQCGPCPYGLPAIAGAVTAIAHGTARARAHGDLERWLRVVPGRGACRHPDGAVRFAASALTTFAADVAHHATHGPCSGAHLPAVLPIPDRRSTGPRPGEPATWGSR